MGDALANWLVNKFIHWVCIIFAVGIALGTLYGWHYNRLPNETLSIDQKIKDRAEQLYIEYRAEQRALDRLEGEVK